MPRYDYDCPNCGTIERYAKMSECEADIECVCGATAKRMLSVSVAITNTRDQFGVGKSFVHENEDGTRKEITTRKEWEKAGYKDALSCHKGAVKEKIKEKMDKIKRKNGQKTQIGGI